MTQEEIISMALKAGCYTTGADALITEDIDLKHFFELAFEAGATNERKACSNLVLNDAWALTFQTFGQYRKALNAAIRARGDCEK